MVMMETYREAFNLGLSFAGVEFSGRIQELTLKVRRIYLDSWSGREYR